jgi:galactoside O-acetyltransferase
MAVFTNTDLEKMGFASLGANLRISDRASFYGCANISIGDNVRIDDFCVLSAGHGGIQIGNHIHIAVYTCLIGQGRITLSDFCNLSSRVSIYSSSDDFSGAAMTNPMVPARYTRVNSADVFLGRHVIVGSGTVVLPGACLNDGVAIGAMSLVRSDCAEFGIYAGSPLRFLRDRKRDLLELERQFLLDSTRLASSPDVA